MATGFDINQNTTNDTSTGLTGPKEAEARITSTEGSFDLDNRGTKCVVTESGVTAVTFDL